MVDHLLARRDRVTRFLDHDFIRVQRGGEAHSAASPSAAGRGSSAAPAAAASAAVTVTPIETAEFDGADPQARLADVLARIADTPVDRRRALLPWNWRPPQRPGAIAA